MGYNSYSINGNLGRNSNLDLYFTTDKKVTLYQP